jgi:hypothetical protein
MTLTPTTLREANEFVANFHRHNKPTTGAKYSIGLEYENELVGVAIIGRPVCRHLDNGTTAEVLRVCTNSKAPKGANSKLYAASWKAWRAMGGKKIITYTLQNESGASLRGAGWKILHEVQMKKNGWSVPSRKREWQPVYGQLKFRWEMQIQ